MLNMTTQEIIERIPSLPADDIEAILEAVANYCDEAIEESADPQDGQAYGECKLAVKKAVRHLKKRS